MITIAQIESTTTDDAEVEADARAMLADRMTRFLAHKRSAYLYYRTEYGYTPKAAFKAADAAARPWPCPHYWQDTPETPREQLVRHRAIAIYRAETRTTAQAQPAAAAP